MNVAWYGHLKFKSAPLWVAIAISWGLALFEYILLIPANRIGYGKFSPYQLKILQEIITLSIFTIFAIFYFGEGLNIRYGISYMLIVAAVGVAFYK
jgi:uncharacterized protein (DUF486 family)